MLKPRWIIALSLLSVGAAVVVSVGFVATGLEFAVDHVNLSDEDSLDGRFLDGGVPDGGKSGTSADDSSDRPASIERQVLRADQRHDWPELLRLSRQLIILQPENARPYADAAKALSLLGKDDESLETLLEGNRVCQYRNPELFSLALKALLYTGRVCDAIELLKQRVHRVPEATADCRLLVNLLMELERRDEVLNYYPQLIRARAFDAELLMNATSNDVRIHENSTMTDLVKRYPDDPRPLVGVARTHLDHGQFDQSLEVLKRILEAHPDDPAANRLLGRVFATREDFASLAAWLERATERSLDSCDDWLTQGDWMRGSGSVDLAAICYARAWKQDPNRLEAVIKLRDILRANPTVPANETIDDLLTRHIDVLAELRPLLAFKMRSPRGDKRKLAYEIGQLLERIGRHWESEAWFAIALLQNPSPIIDEATIHSARDQAITALRKDRQWQRLDPALEVFLGDLANDRTFDDALAARLADTSSQPRKGDKRDGQYEAPESTLVLVDEAAERGLIFDGPYSSIDRTNSSIELHQSLGCGVGVLDFDHDGNEDLYFSAAGGTPFQDDSDASTLFRNLDGTFFDCGGPSGTLDSGYGQGVSVGDYDEDGFADLLVLNMGSTRLYRNNGDGTLSDVSQACGLDSNDWVTSGAFADLDADGLSDLILLRYWEGKEFLDQPCVDEHGTTRSCSPLAFPSASDRFMRQKGDGTFVEFPRNWGFGAAESGRALGIVAGNLDGRTGTDVYIANDMSANHFWTQAEANRYVELAKLNGLATDYHSVSQGSMGIAVADLLHNGNVSFLVTNFQGEPNALYLNQGQATWQDKCLAFDVASASIAWVGFGSCAADLDSDGQYEVITTNGHVDFYSETSARQPLQGFRFGSENRVVAWLPHSAFTDYGQQHHVGRALATIDADRDFHEDLVITHLDEPVALLANRTVTNNHAVEVILVGHTSPRDAVGATVQVETNKDAWVIPVFSGGSYYASSRRAIRIGLGDSERLSKLQVQWPAGTRQSFAGLQAGKTYLIVEFSPEAFAL